VKKAAFLDLTPLLLLLALAAPAAAQEDKDPFAEARFRMGPLAFTPTLTLTTLGVDTNVFNEWEDPKQDFVFAAGPKVDSWFRLGRARLHGIGNVEYLFFKEYANQRGFNSRGELVFELPLFRLMPYVGISGVNTRDRPGFEIDARARHTEQGWKAGFELRLTAKTRLDLGVQQNRYRFSGDEVFLGTFLRDVLDRDIETVKASFRYAITPLTTLVLDTDATRERFVTERVRDADSVRITPGVDFDAFAFISGSARLGVRKLDMRDPSIPNFSGFVGKLDLAHTLLGDTRLAVNFERDVEYSYQILQPYYVRTGVGGSVNRRLVGNWDILVRGARHKLEYRRSDDPNLPVSPGDDFSTGRVDRVETLGGGIGYRFSSGTRVGVNVDQFRRRSALDRRTYKGLRAGLTVTYGF
jgi:hypothetical protein